MPLKNAPALRKGLSLTISGIPWKASYQWLRRESKEAVFDLSNIVRRRVQISEQIALSHESSIQAGQDFVSRSRPDGVATALVADRVEPTRKPFLTGLFGAIFLFALYRILLSLRASMRLQSLIGSAMLVLPLGLGVWVALQYVPVHWH